MATAVEMLFNHLHAVEELVRKFDYEMKVERGRDGHVFVYIDAPELGGGGVGSGAQFAVALKRSVMSLQDELVYEDPEVRERVLGVLERNEII